MPKYANVHAIYITLHGLPDEALRASITRTITRAISRDRLPSGIDVFECEIHTVEHLHRAYPLPASLQAMQDAAAVHAKGEGEVYWLGQTMGDAIAEWARHAWLTNPKAQDKIPRMSFAAIYGAMIAYRRRDRLAAEEAEALRLKMLPIQIAQCPVVHTYPDGWRWVHVSSCGSGRLSPSRLGRSSTVCLMNAASSYLASQLDGGAPSPSG